MFLIRRCSWHGGFLGIKRASWKLWPLIEGTTHGICAACSVKTFGEDETMTSTDKVCPRIDSCYKIAMIMDKDILDFQAADAIRSVCAKCTESVGGKGQ